MVENDFGVEAFRMLLEALHQFRSLYAQRIGRPVIHISGRHQLAALLDAGDQQRFQVGAGCVHRCRITGRTGAENQYMCVLWCGHGMIT